MPRILIIEDNTDLANMVRATLEAEGHSVLLCDNGAAGLSNILGQPYDLVVLDWDLPEVNGIAILRRFRATGAQTPVIMLTGKSTIENKETGLDSGADDYLTKPFSMTELAARVRSQLRRGSARMGKELLHLGAITLDLVNSQASKGGRTHVLSSAEFDLLKLSATYPHVDWNQRDLIKAAWPDSAEDGEEKLRNAIRRLRKKLDSEGKLIFPGVMPEVGTAVGANQESDESNSSLPMAPPAALEAADDENSGDPYLGTIIDGKYEVLEFIGGGGSGVVYKAKHNVLGHFVALKVLHMPASARSDAGLRFEREAKLAASLSHEHLISVRDIGQTGIGQPYIVMDLVHGISLDELLQSHQELPINAILDVFLQVTRALQYLSERGLVHRDVKPANIMLAVSLNGLQVKLVDLGMTRPHSLDAQASKITHTGTVLGSACYMSPEQCRGENVDCRSDIYSLGCSLYEALEDKKAFEGKDPVETILKHITEDAPPLSATKCSDSSLQERLSRIVRKCLARQKEERFQTPAELAYELSSCLPPERWQKSVSAFATDSRGDNWEEMRRQVISWITAVLAE